MLYFLEYLLLSQYLTSFDEGSLLHKVEGASLFAVSFVKFGIKSRIKEGFLIEDIVSSRLYFTEPLHLKQVFGLVVLLGLLVYFKLS